MRSVMCHEYRVWRLFMNLPGQFEVVSAKQHCNQYYDPPRAAIFVNYIHFYEGS